MKTIMFVLVCLLTTTLSFSQEISDVSQSGNALTVLDENNRTISSKYIGSNDQLCGFSSTIIVVQSGTAVYVYDQNFKTISSKYIDGKVKNVVGNKIIVKTGNAVYTYDKNWKVITSRYE
jgi:hypothetical protein